MTVLGIEKEKRHAVCESRMEVPENTTITCEKFMVYTSSQDMEADKLEAFAKKRIKRGSLKTAGRRNLRLRRQKSMSSGRFPMCRSMMMRHCSRESASTCFTLCSLREETDAPEWGQRDFPGKAMRDIISGIRRCMCCRYLCIRHRSWRRSFWNIVSVP